MSDKKWTEVEAKSESEIWDRENPIEGEIVKIQDNVGPNASKLYTLRTAKGDVGVWGSTIIDAKMAELYLNDQVKIEPLGKVKAPSTGRDYWDFRVSYIEGERKPKAMDNLIGGGEPIESDDIPFDD